MLDTQPSGQRSFQSEQETPRETPRQVQGLARDNSGLGMWGRERGKERRGERGELRTVMEEKAHVSTEAILRRFCFYCNCNRKTGRFQEGT